MKKRVFAVVALLVVAAFVMTACTREGAGTTDGPRTHLNIVGPNLAVSMDPHQSNDAASAHQNKQVFSTLLKQCYDTFGPLPGLAVSWETPDAQTVNIQLRQGVTFHNGDPLTAADVQFSLERAAASAEMGIIIGMLDHVTVHDNYNLTLHLEIPFAPILSHLAHPGTSIIPMNHVLEVGDEAFADAPVGTGPFKVTSIVIGDRTEFVRFDNYWGERSVIETITWRAVPDPSTRLIEVISGYADFAIDLAAADIPSADADPNAVLITRQNLALNDWISFNTSKPPFNDIRVRQAIAYALDTDLIMRTVWGDLGSPAQGPISNNVWGFSPQTPRPGSNMDRARELLAEAGLADGFSFEFWWNTPNIQRQQVGEMVQFVLAELNIDVEVVAMEWPTILSITAVTDPAETQHHAFCIGWVAVTGDADYGLFPPFHSSNFGGAGNRSFWHNAEVDALLEAGRASVDLAERLRIYDRVQYIVNYEVPVIPIRQGMAAHAMSPSLRGFVIAPAGHNYFARVFFAD